MYMEAWSSHGCAWRLGVVMDVHGGLECHEWAWRLGVVMDVHGVLE